jgi:hypothetical protein
MGVESTFSITYKILIVSNRVATGPGPLPKGETEARSLAAADRAKES